MTHWLEQHMLPCQFKSLTGIDCPGCGFQRSVISMVNGDFHESFMQYPPLYFLLLFLLVLFLVNYYRPRAGNLILYSSLSIYILSIFTNYITKFI